MSFFPARKILRFVLLSAFLAFLFIFFPKIQSLTPQAVYAQDVTVNPTAGPPAPDSVWQFDPVVTEVGKNSERARQLLWWVFSHPGIDSAPVLAQLWGISRNIVYIFIILVIVALGVGLIVSSRKGSMGPIFSGISSPVAGLNIPSILVKVGMILVYVTFSYIFVLAMIQLSQITMKFFIENVGGKDLFNVIFAGAGNKDDNYISFIGYSDTNPLNREMVNTSLFLIRMTSLTYFVMAVIVILRTIILWFLLILSPFLALLMPFVFIRNIGWIWIGVFFQWLFYGPLLSLFLASLTRIWIAGIPYPFDFSRVNKASGQVYKTAINILYGGPAQTISPGNSANYVDTYAEYVIALIMLWTAIVLPWLLLRIFRDYCCAGIAAAGATLNAIFDRLRQYPPPPSLEPVKVPVTVSGVALELPFRQKVKEEVQITKRTEIEEIREITRESTNDIANKMDMAVKSLADVSKFEMDKMRQSNFQNQLRRISTPQSSTSSFERERYSTLRSELQKRAAGGDVLAKSMLTASDNKVESMVANMPIGARRPMVTTSSKSAGVYAPLTAGGTSVTASPAAGQTPVSGVSLSQIVPDVAQKTSLSETKVKDILQMIPSLTTPSTTKVKEIASRNNVAEEKVKEVVAMAQMISASKSAEMKKVKRPGAAAISNVEVSVGGQTVESQVSVEDYEEVKKMWLKHYREAPIPTSETIKTRDEWLNEETKKLTNISNLLSSSDQKLKQKGLEEVAEILPFLLLGGFSDVETLTYLKAKLEAAKQIQTELEIEQKAKEAVKEEMEEEETLVEVSAKKEEKKEAKASGEQSMDIPKEKSEEKSPANDAGKDKEKLPN
ncbi:MAG: hypothetical protein M1366_06360 [Patescibacteria group bacterium]|nr:hypothetical protein [Patescibacteria group bacterium]